MKFIFFLKKDPVLTDFIRKNLENSGHNLIEKENIHECIKPMNNEDIRPNLILVDETSVMDGGDVCFAIKENDILVPVVPIIDTDQCIREVYDTCNHLCHGHITLPFTKNQFISKINSILPPEKSDIKISDLSPDGF